MKTSILILFIIGLIVVGCSTTTHFNLTATYPEYLEKEFNKVEKDSGLGVEVSLLLNNGGKHNGELLSVRDSTITLCTEYSATEEELAKLTYPILLFSNNEIQQLTIEGSNWVWEGIAAGTVVGFLAALVIGSAIDKGEGTSQEKWETFETAGSVVFLLGIAAGWGTGYALSTEEYVLQDVPIDYNFSILRNLSRYPDEEPEYLKVMD
jgi:hypothetical protein